MGTLIWRSSAIACTLLAGACGFSGRNTVSGLSDEVCPWPFTPLHVDPCESMDALPTSLELAGGAYTFETDTGVLTDPGGKRSLPVTSVVDDLRVLWTMRFAIAGDASLRATGTLPLHVVALTDISIDGTLDVGSRWDMTAGMFSIGANGNAPACSTHTSAPGRSCEHGGSGGGGGGFGGAGGEGGRGGQMGNCPTAPPGIDGGAGGTAVVPATLRGGCGGGTGGYGNGSLLDVGIGAPGGGAVHLLAGGAVTIGATGVVQAGGAGGRPGKAGRAGAGGGGSGGMIGLEGSTVVVVDGAVLAANGGGGGGGCNGDGAKAGADGLATAMAAPGGMREGGGGDGGAAGAMETLAMPGMPAQRGGGGGGGGVGVIQLRAELVMTHEATVSPVPVN